MANMFRSVLASSGPAPTGGDALPAEVLSGKTFTNDNGFQTGTMPNNGAVTQLLTYDQEYTISVGYHNGSGKVTAPSKGTLNLTNPLYQGTGANITYTHSSSVSEALILHAGGTSAPTITPSSGVTVDNLGSVVVGFLTLYLYHLSNLTNGSTVTATGGGGSSMGVFSVNGVNIT